MPDPSAYFLTWHTYGTWLPGDERGWVRRGKGVQMPNQEREKLAQARMTETPCKLDRGQRELVEETIVSHCAIRGWELLTVRCLTNHVHVVVAADCHPDVVCDQFKAWSTRKLKEQQRDRNGPVRLKWWEERASQRYLISENDVEAAVQYVNEAQ